MNVSQILLAAFVVCASQAPSASGADHCESLFKSACTYVESGDVNRAIATLTEVIRCDPQSADAYYKRGTCFASKGNQKEAIADCSKAIQLKPSAALFYNERSNAYFALGEYDKARADCQE